MKGYSFRSLTDLVLKIFKTKVNAGTGLSGGGSLEADRTLAVKYGTTTGTATQGDDSRVVNAASNATVNAKEAALEAKKADKAITITAGTGLSGGGTLAANRSLSVKYGTDSGTAAQGNDSRLSNSREWTASTVSQAEAEAGTATTRRAFTAQRVRQATVAWWNSITGAFGRDLVTSADNSVARDKLGLHTSALRWPTWAEVTGKPDPWPVGVCYTQYPDTPTPQSIFGGTWKQLFNTEGVFFRTEGGGASSFGGGVQGDDNKSHTHAASTNNTGGHSHSASTNSTGAHTHSLSGTANSAGAHRHTIDLGSGEEDSRGGNNQGGKNKGYNDPTSTAGEHTHTISGTAASAGAHSHTVSVETAGAHAHTITVNASGGNEARPKNRTIRVWQRTA